MELPKGRVLEYMSKSTSPVLESSSPLAVSDPYNEDLRVLTLADNKREPFAAINI